MEPSSAGSALDGSVRPAAPDRAPPRRLARRRIVPVVVACPLFLQNLDTSVMATALPSIARSLDVRVLDLNLAITAYLLSLAVFLPVSGWLADRFGSRRMFCVAIGLFSLGSALCGVAGSLPTLVAYRLLQGAGGAMMLPVGRMILLRTVPPSEIVAAMVWFTIPGAVGRLVGPFFGGAVVTLASWHWIFLINLPFGVLGVALALCFIDRDGDAPTRRPLDLVGFALLALGLANLLGGLEIAGKGMLPARVSVEMVGAGIVVLGAYVWHSRRSAEPLIDLRIFRYESFRAATVGGMPLRIAIGASPFLLPLMFQLGFGLSPLDSGLLTMATALGSLGTRALIAQAIRLIGFRALLMGATTLSALFYASYGLLTPHTPHLAIFVVLVLGGLCSSLAMVSLNTLGYTEIPKDRISHATTTSTMAQQLSICLGVVVGASLLTLVGLWRSGSAVPLRAADFTPTFAAIGAVTLLSVAWFRGLQPEQGEGVRG